MSSKNTNEEHEIDITSLNLEIIIREGTDKIITKLFNSLLHRYRESLQTMIGSEFVFDFVNGVFYKFHTNKPKPLRIIILRNGSSTMDQNQRSNNTPKTMIVDIFSIQYQFH